MGGLFSKPVADTCKSEEPELLKLLQEATSVGKSPEKLKDVYNRALAINACNSKVSTDYKNEIFNAYQDILVAEAREILAKYTSETTPDVETIQEKITKIESRTKALESDIGLVNVLLTDYSRDQSGAEVMVELTNIKAADDVSLGKLMGNVDIMKAKAMFAGIVCNYGLGTGTSSGIRQSAKNYIDKYLNPAVYKFLLMFSELQPLLWPVDYKDVDVDKYYESGNLHAILENLSRYYSTHWYKKVDNTGVVVTEWETDKLKIKEFMDATIMDAGTFFTEGKKILKKFGVHRWKSLRFMANKQPNNISGKMMVPVTWPKFNPDYEQTEAIVCICNALFISVSRGKGRTFILPDVDALYDEIYDPKPWGTDSSKLLINSDDIVPVVVKGTVTGKIEDAPGVNNTGFITDKLFNIYDNIENTGIPDIPSLSCFRLTPAPELNIGLITELFKGINSDDNFNNRIRTSGMARIFNSVDYLTMDTTGFARTQEFVAFVYHKVITDALRWQIIIPFNSLKTTMSICKNDIDNGCSKDALLPMAFGFRQDADGKKYDPLFT